MRVSHTSDFTGIAAVNTQRSVLTVQLGAGIVAQHRAAKQEAVAVSRGIPAQQNIVVGEVVTERILKRQLDMVQLGVGRHVHRQTRAGKMAGVVQTNVMFNYRRFCPFCQLEMVAIVGGVDLAALNTG